MSEFGPMVDPYRVAPPKGGLLEAIMQFAGMQQQMAQQRDMEAERAGTNFAINQREGWSGVDPFKVQQFDQTGQQMRIAGATEDRTAQDFQQRQQFGEDMVGGARPHLVNNSDPLLASLAQARANPYVAQILASQMQAVSGDDRRFQNQRTLQGDAQGFETEQERARQQFAINMAMQQALDSWNRVDVQNQFAQSLQTDDQNFRKQQRENEVNVAKTQQQQLADAVNALGTDPNAVGKAIALNPALARDFEPIAVYNADVRKALEQAKIAQGLLAGSSPTDAASSISLPKSRAEQTEWEQKEREQKRQQDFINNMPDKEKAYFEKYPDLIERIRREIQGSKSGVDYKKIVPYIYKEATRLERPRQISGGSWSPAQW